MKAPWKNQSLLLKMREAENESLEKYISAITDDLLIFDPYYANIQSANALIFEMCCEASINNDHFIEIVFKNNTKGVIFEVLLDKLFLDIVKYINTDEKYNKTDEKHEENAIRMNIIGQLCDRISINDKNKSIELTFFINGINETLNHQRIELLNSYFSKTRIKIH